MNLPRLRLAVLLFHGHWLSTVPSWCGWETSMLESSLASRPTALRCYGSSGFRKDRQRPARREQGGYAVLGFLMSLEQVPA
jgi:hypothetical protein